MRAPGWLGRAQSLQGLQSACKIEGSLVAMPPETLFMGDKIRGSDSCGYHVGKRQREMYRQIHGSHLCPAKALNPSFGRSALTLPLIGLWTRGATTGQTCSGRPGQRRGASCLTWRDMCSQAHSQLPLRLEGCAREKHLHRPPQQALSSQNREVAWLVIQADKTGVRWQAQADYSL